MKILTPLLLALVLASASLLPPSAAMAQVTEVDAQMATSAIMSSGSRAARVRALDKVPSVGVVRLDLQVAPRFRGDVPDWTEYKLLARKYAGGVARLQNALNANPVTRAVLSKRGILPAQVVGVQVSSNGSLRLYIFSRRHLGL